MRCVTKKMDGIFLDMPVTYKGEVVGRVIGMDRDNVTMAIDKHEDEIKSALHHPQSISLEVRPNEKV